MHRIIPAALLAVMLAVAPARADDPDQRAAATEARMTPEERIAIVHGILAMPFAPPVDRPGEVVLGAGYVPGVPRLGVPPLTETDASLGVANVLGLRHDEGATPLPSGVAMAATWDPALARRTGAAIGAEARAKGFNVMLAGGANLMRDPRNGRTFEYLSEDPWLTGLIAGGTVAGIQSNRMISTVKHFALNGQETGRLVIDSRIGEAAARESDLLAFQIAIERGHPSAVMCAYNVVNGAHACDSAWLLNTVLKGDWRYPGFVMSDWGAVHGVMAAFHGLDQESGAQFDRQLYFGDLLAAAAAGPEGAERLHDMDRRILRSIYANGLDSGEPARPADTAAAEAVARQVADEGIVLLRNARGVLPLAAGAGRIAVIGGHANAGVLSGGGSSQVTPAGGPAIVVPRGGVGPFPLDGEQYHPPAPLRAIRARTPGATIIYRDGRYPSEAATAARGADIAIVFATQWTSEGQDVPDLSLPEGQDAVIDAVAEANPNTVVVLETGGPVLMPWLDKTAAVVEAWYPGARGADAIAAVLFGDRNPAGRLPITFPAGLDQLPRPKLDGSDILDPDGTQAAMARAGLFVDYSIEGSDVGYRWFARQGRAPLFPFGFGLGYTRFDRSGLTMDGLTARFEVANTGARDGADVAQLYLVSRPGGRALRLAGFERVALAAGERRAVTLTIDPRLIASWTEDGWSIPEGRYGFALGADAAHLGPVTMVALPGRIWRD